MDIPTSSLLESQESNGQTPCISSSILGSTVLSDDEAHRGQGHLVLVTEWDLSFGLSKFQDSSSHCSSPIVCLEGKEGSGDFKNQDHLENKYLKYSKTVPN